MRTISIFFLLFFSCTAFAQFEDENLFFNEISFDYGIFNSLNSSEYENLTGNRMSIQTAHFFINDLGFRTGITTISNLEGAEMFYAVPLYISYRTRFEKSYSDRITVESLSDIFYKVILGLVPKQAEINLGTNIGYIIPDSNLGLSSINGSPLIQRGYSADQRFVSTLDLGFRLNYNIRRFRIAFSPILSYMLSQNFRYYSEDDINNGYTPDLFLTITIGAAYQF